MRVAGALLALGLSLTVAWVRWSALQLEGVDGAAEWLARIRLGQQIAATPPAGLAAGDLGAWRDTAVAAAIARDPDGFAREVAAVARSHRESLTLERADGRRDPFLDDLDSYLWLRRAERLLETGSPCDEVVAGVCRDNHTLAPVGREMIYPRPLHVEAIAAAHRLASFVDPGRPLFASAALVPLVAGSLCVLPAFAIGRRLAGWFAGATAAVILGLNPFFVLRSAGSDNDVWNVLLPLLAVSAALAAIASAGTARAAAWALGAAAVVGLQAWAWSGWLFLHVVLSAGLLAHGLLGILALAAAHRAGAMWPAAARALAPLAAYTLGAALATAAAGEGGTALLEPWRQIFRHLPAPALAGEVPLWPDPLATVDEIRAAVRLGPAESIHGLVPFWAAWLGLLLLSVPERRPRARHLALLAAGGLWFLHLGFAAPSAPWLALSLAIPLAAGALLRVLADDEPVSHASAPLLLALWFLGALLQAAGGPRFEILLLAPFAVACGAVLGRARAWLDAAALRLLGGAVKITARTAVIVLLALPLLLYARDARAVVLASVPKMNDAWWQALSRLRLESPADAIVTTTWDYGHWASYVAGRRVSADGSTLLTRAPQWIAGALLAPSEDETAGLLRLLACGSDAAGLPEESQGAYRRLMQRGGLGAAEARAVAVEIAAVDRDAAARRLEALGIAAAAAEEILAASHCEPPPSYLVLTDRMAWLRWWKIGAWNGAAGRRARSTGEAPSAGALAVGAHGFLTPAWVPCFAAGDEILCPISAEIEAGTTLQSVSYVPSAPGASRLLLSGPAGESRRVPAALVVAAPDGLQEPRGLPVNRIDWAVLYDVVQQRALVASPDLVRSTFTQLAFLDGRYSRRFRRFDERTSALGERVSVWEVLPAAGS